MDSIIEAQIKLVPEMLELLQHRYRVLKIISVSGPIGRRPLCQLAGLSEREIRTMMDILRNLNLIHIAKEGTSITSEGAGVLIALEKTMEQWTERSSIAKRLVQLLGIKTVRVVAGDSDTDLTTKNYLGLEAATQFTAEIANGKIVAVTGGSSIAAIPPHIDKSSLSDELMFIAARGGVGTDIELQANVIAATFAQASGGSYNTFYYPETLSEGAHEAFRQEPSVVKMTQLYGETDCVLHGIGDAQAMAELRDSSVEDREMLKNCGAEGEAFGYYFDKDGKIVHRIRTIGVRTDHLERIPLIISVAGGHSKAKAILAYMASAPKQTILVTDEGAAFEMLRLLVERQQPSE